MLYDCDARRHVCTEVKPTFDQHLNQQHYTRLYASERKPAKKEEQKKKKRK